MPVEDIKLCKDCRYLDSSIASFYCIHPSAISYTCVISGSTNYWTCSDCRKCGTKCGQEGKYFEPKPSLLDKLKSWLKK